LVNGGRPVRPCLDSALVAGASDVIHMHPTSWARRITEPPYPPPFPSADSFYFSIFPLLPSTYQSLPMSAITHTYRVGQVCLAYW